MSSPNPIIEIEAARLGPPPELLKEMLAAGETHEQLLERGRELRFHPASPTEGAGVERYERDSALAQAISIGDALEIVAGSPWR